MKTTALKTVAILVIAMLLLPVTSAFARNKTGEPETAEVVSIKSTGRVDGIVKDLNTGKPIKNAVICIEGCKTGAMTNDRGKFFMREVPCGSCTLKVAKAGYTVVENAVVVKDGERTLITVKLKPAQS